MPKAMPGSVYIVEKGDNLSKIASQAYGDPSKWGLIWKANQTVLRSEDPNVIFPGEVINIPSDPIVADAALELGFDSPDLQGKDKDEFTLIVNGIEIKVLSSNTKTTIDTGSDGWTAVIYWDRRLKEVSEAARPFAYNNASVYHGGFMDVNGYLFITQIDLDPSDGDTAILSGFSFTKDIVDSTVRPPYEINNVSLRDLAKEIASIFGISAEIQADIGEKFNRVTVEPTETYFSFLSRLAAQRKVLVSSTRTGNLILWNANELEPVGTISDDGPPGMKTSITYDGTKRFNVYKAIGQTPKNHKISAVSKDPAVPRSRFLTFSVGESTKGDIQNTANWKRSKQLTDALVLKIPVDSWYAPNGKLWEVNTIVTVVSKKLFIDTGFDFLIKSVEKINSTDGTTAILGLVPPQVYTGGELDEPWIFL